MNNKCDHQSCYDCKSQDKCYTKDFIGHCFGLVDCMVWGIDKAPFDTFSARLTIYRNIAANCKNFLGKNANPETQH